MSNLLFFIILFSIIALFCIFIILFVDILFFRYKRHQKEIISSLTIEVSILNDKVYYLTNALSVMEEDYLKLVEFYNRYVLENSIEKNIND